MTRRPGRVKEVIDIAQIAGENHWRSDPFDEVIRRADFQDMRSRIWGLVKSEISGRN